MIHRGSHRVNPGLTAMNGVVAQSRHRAQHRQRRSKRRDKASAAADLCKLGLEMGIRMIQVESDRPQVIIGIDDPKNLWN
jgi:hypothetical protein